MERVIGEISGNGQKQLLIAIGGMHGNEPAGILAIDRVLDILAHQSKAIKGKFLGLRGNLGALKLKRRYLQSDLNRIWTAKDFTSIDDEGFDFNEFPDHRELDELWRLVDHEISQGYDQIVVIDLHTTSATSGVFIACNNDTPHRALVSQLHVPVIVNLVEELNGTAMQYFWQKGCTAFAFEGGNHFNPESVNKMESALWLCMECMGMINRKTFNNVTFHDHRLKNSTVGLPHFCELVYHHSITPDDEFVMKPGYHNFQSISKGEVLAKDKKGAVLSPCDGRILMPLYQNQGTDGFFVVKEIDAPSV